MNLSIEESVSTCVIEVPTDFEPFLSTRRSSHGEVAGDCDKLKEESANLRDALEKCRALLSKFAKERDFHAREHRRVVHERDRLMRVGDVKLLRNLLDEVQPELSRLKYVPRRISPHATTNREKNEVLFREKALMKIERDKWKISRASVAKPPIEKLQERRTSSQQSTPREETRKWSEFQLPALHTVTQPFVPHSLVSDGSINIGHGAVSRIRLSVSQVIAIGSDDGCLSICNSPKAPPTVLGNHQSFISGIAWCSESVVASSDGNGSVAIWNVDEKRRVQTYNKEHVSCAWSLDCMGDYLLTGSMDCTAKLIDLGCSKVRYTMRGHSNSVNCSVFAKSEYLIFTCSADKTVASWDTRTGSHVRRWKLNGGPVNAICSNGGNKWISVDAAGFTTVVDTRTNEILWRQKLGASINAVAIIPDGSVAAVALEDGSVRMQDIENCQIHDHLLCMHDSAALDVVWGFAGSLVSSDCGGVVKYWSSKDTNEKRDYSNWILQFLRSGFVHLAGYCSDHTRSYRSLSQ